MKLFLIRLRACWNILTQNYKHWVIMYISDKDLENLLEDKDFDLDMHYHKMKPYIIHKMIRRAYEDKDEIDMLEERLKFKIEADKFTNNF